jgi:hypothetical protein
VSHSTKAFTVSSRTREGLKNKKDDIYQYVVRKPLNKKSKKSRTMGKVAHMCNPNYSGGRDQEDCGSRSAGQS